MGLFKKPGLSEKGSEKKKKKVDPFVAEKIKAGVPIDHGWAWMCVLACHVMNMLMSGLIRSQGILYLELVELFDSTSVETMWVFSISGFCVNSVAPFSNSFAARFSSRQVVFIGALLVAFGFIISNFAISLKFMYISYGIFVGIGFGLVYAPTITTVGYYFHERRALANGLSVAGSSVGALFMPRLVTLLIDRYSVKGAFIIIGGIMLHLCFTASLLRPMEYYVERKKRLDQLKQAAAGGIEEGSDAAGDVLKQGSKAAGHTGDDSAAAGASQPASEQVYGRFRVLPAMASTALNPVPESQLEDEEALAHVAMMPPEPPSEPCTPPLHRSARALKVLSKFSTNALVPRSHGSSQRWQSMNSLHSSSSGLAGDPLQGQNPQRTRSCVAVVMSVPGCPHESSELPTLFEAGLERRVSDSDIGSAQTTLTHGGRTLPIFSESALQAVRKELVRLEQNKVLKRSRPTSHSFRRLLVPRLSQAKAMLSRRPSTSIVASVPDLTFASLQNLPQRWSVAYEPKRRLSLRTSILEFCKLRQKVAMGGKVRRGKGVPIIDPWVLRQPSFYLLMIGMALCITIFGANFMLVPSYAEMLGIPKKDSAVFMQYMGITDLCGRLFNGWLADLNLVPRKYLLIFFFICEGFIGLLVPVVFCSYNGLVVYSLLLGLFAGSVIPLTAVVICDALGIRRLSSAFGMSMFLFGVASAIIPSLLSLLRDLNGSWDSAFYFCGSMCLFAAVLVIIDTFVSPRFPITDDDSESSSGHSSVKLSKTNGKAKGNDMNPEIIITYDFDEDNNNVV